MRYRLFECCEVLLALLLFTSYVQPCSLGGDGLHSRAGPLVGFEIRTVGLCPAVH